MLTCLEKKLAAKLSNTPTLLAQWFHLVVAKSHWIVWNLHADSPDPTTCWVTDRNGKSLHVRVDSLRPLAADIDEKLMPKDLSWKISDQFIVYDAPAGLSGGIISIVDSDSTTVHDYMPIVCKTCVTWAPLWIPVDNPNADPIRSTKCPHSCSKSLVIDLDRPSLMLT